MPKKFKCFSCKSMCARSELGRAGKRANGSRWYLCRECQQVYRAEREMDTQALHAAEGDVRVGEKDWETPGWNGIPSERSLRRRVR